MSTEQNITPDIVYLIREVLEVYADPSIEPPLAKAFALAVEDNFDVDLSAFTTLQPTCHCDDCDEEGTEDGPLTVRELQKAFDSAALTEAVMRKMKGGK